MESKLEAILKTRLSSYVWRAGPFVVVAVAGYLMNIADVRSIDLYKLTTIFVTTLAVYAFNEATKYLNSNR